MGDYKAAEVFPQLDSGVAELDDLIVRRTSFPPAKFSAGRDSIYMIDCNTEWGFPCIDSAAANSSSVGLLDLTFRHTYFPLGELSAGRDGNYIWRPLWTGLSVCNRIVTGSLALGSSQRLGRFCLWPAALPLRWIGSAEVPRRRHLLPAVCKNTFYKVDAPFHPHLCRHPLGPASGIVLAILSRYDSVISLDSSLCRHPVWPDGGSAIAVMLRNAPLCRQLLVFNPAVRRTASGEGKMCFFLPSFRLILTFCYCLYEFLREQELGTDRKLFSRTD